MVGPCRKSSPGFPGDGGSCLWPVWRRGKGQLPNRLPEDCGRHGTGTATDLNQRRGATSPLRVIRPHDAARTRAWDRGPEIQRYTHPGWIWTREVSGVSAWSAYALMVALNPQCFLFLVILVFCFHKPICLRTWATNQILLYCQTHSFCFPVFTPMFLMELDKMDLCKKKKKTCMFLKGSS